MRYLLFFLLLIVYACENPVTPESRGDKLAQSLCGCMAKLMELNQEAQKTLDSLAFRNIAAEFDKARQCAEKLEIKPEDKATLENALLIKCPTLAANPDLLTDLIRQ